jgi:CheY-like chemotaxis protein
VAKVLVVDDEFGIAEVLAAFLEDEGHEVAIAVNGRMALEQAAADRPGLVITDFMMPVMDGAALLHAVRADPALARVPVVVMSSLPEESFAERASGYTVFVRKPFRMDDVVTLINELLQGHQDGLQGSAHPDGTGKGPA